MQCSKCSQKLSGNSDTFGPIDKPLCQTCHFEELSKAKEPPYTFGITIDEDGKVVHSIKFNRSDSEYTELAKQL